MKYKSKARHSKKNNFGSSVHKKTHNRSRKVNSKRNSKHTKKVSKKSKRTSKNNIAKSKAKRRKQSGGKPFKCYIPFIKKGPECDSLPSDATPSDATPSAATPSDATPSATTPSATDLLENNELNISQQNELLISDRVNGSVKMTSIKRTPYGYGGAE